MFKTKPTAEYLQAKEITPNKLYYIEVFVF